MGIKTGSSPFGGTTRTRVLLALRLLAESYPRELARVLDMPFSSVQKALASLAKDGLVAGRALGQALVKIAARASLADVALQVGDALRRHGIRAVLTGGACASLHTGGV